MPTAQLLSVAGARAEVRAGALGVAGEGGDPTVLRVKREEKRMQARETGDQDLLLAEAVVEAGVVIVADGEITTGRTALVVGAIRL